MAVDYFLDDTEAGNPGGDKPSDMPVSNATESNLLEQPAVNPLVHEAGPQMVQTGGGVDQSYGVSYSGTPEKARKDFAKGFAGDEAYEDAKGEVEKAQLSAPFKQTAQSQQDNIISAQDAANAPSQYQAELNKTNAQSRWAQKMADLQGNFAMEEKKASAAAETLRQSALARYTAQIQAYNSMDVNPGELWGEMGKGGRAQSLASIFTHNFLGARGIQTTAMDTLNRGVDLAIQTQIARINKAGAVTDHFGKLYQLVKDESATEAEARDRLRGFYLTQAQKMMEADLLKYDAPIAQAKGAEMRLNIQQELNKTLYDIDSHVSARVDAAKTRHLEMRKAELTAAAQSAELKERKREFNAMLPINQENADTERDKVKATKQQAATDTSGLVVKDVDPNSPTYGQPQKMILPGMSPAQTAAIREMGSSTTGLMSDLAALRDLVAQHRVTPFDAEGQIANVVQTTTGMSIQALKEKIAAELAIINNGGSRPSDFDAKKAAEQIPVNDWFTRGDGDKVINDLITTTKRDYDSKMTAFTRDITPDDMPFIHNMTGTGANEGKALGTEAKDYNNGQVLDDTDQELKAAEAPNGDHATGLKNAVLAAKLSKDPNQLKKVIGFAESIKDQAVDQQGNWTGKPDAFGGADFIDEQIQAASDAYKELTGEYPMGTVTGDRQAKDEINGIMQISPKDWSDEQKTKVANYVKAKHLQ